MPRVKKPPARPVEIDDDEDDAPPVRHHRASRGPYMPYSVMWLRQKFATYALGTLVGGAAMVTVAAWMGGSLGDFGTRLDTGFRVILKTVGLTVETVKVVGVEGVVKDKVLEVAAVARGDSMLSADPYRIKHRVEKLDAVGEVSVYRFWPDQVTIIAEAREPMALWEDETGWRVVDQRGRAFAEAEPAQFVKLPRVKGLEAAKAAPAFLTVLADFPDLRAKLDTAYRIGDRRWNVRFRGGVEVVLPEDARLKEALTALNLAEARNRLLELPLTRIDARNPDRFALRPAPGAPAIVLGGA